MHLFFYVQPSHEESNKKFAISLMGTMNYKCGFTDYIYTYLVSFSQRHVYI